jgi:hypothetical protein
MLVGMVDCIFAGFVNRYRHSVSFCAITRFGSKRQRTKTYTDVAQPDQARIVAINATNFLKNNGGFMISIKANCIDSTAAPEVYIFLYSIVFTKVETDTLHFCSTTLGRVCERDSETERGKLQAERASQSGTVRTRSRCWYANRFLLFCFVLFCLKQKQKSHHFVWPYSHWNVPTNLKSNEKNK